MSDDKKDLPVLFARIEEGKLGHRLVMCAHYGADAQGRTVSQILSDHLSTQEASTVGDGIFVLGSVNEGVVLAHMAGDTIGVGVVAGAIALPIAVPAAAAAFLWSVFDGSRYENRMVRVTIVNCFDQPIVVGPAQMRHGDEFAQCAAGTMSKDGKTFLPTTQRQVPGLQALRIGAAEAFCYGVGMFAYQRHTTASVGMYGTEGTLTFTCADPRFGPNTIGFAFVNGYGTDIRCALAPDMSQFGSLQGDAMAATMDKFHSWAIDDAGTRSTTAIARLLQDGPLARVYACLAGAHSTGRGTFDLVDFVIAFQPN